ncbi:nuclear transport factor 2 family protein [Nocardia sp. NBC_00565]|uniref:nuclear transport factor 2 family protein n=1 Tax=Nocardia sp. NBC_00565 TaxID=2975993 RepID=UPI002E81604B|nr:nuclear transport factor 2 family protein [Nocardia sp. NBC_00565]WUC03431.1 nuclear transport factor 2 family protein [Nocardia sp. NBC_00565]
MSVENHRRFLAGPGERRALRTAMALGTATMLGAVGISMANAEPPAPPGVFSATDAAADIAAVKQLKTDYFHNIDTKNWAALRELLAPDVVVDTTGSGGPILVGRDPFIAFLKLTIGSANTHHQGFDPQINLTSATTAEVGWRMEDVLIFGGTLGVHGYGNYQDRYTKVNGKWIIKYSKLTRTRLDLINPDDGTVIEADAPLEEVVAKVNELLGL